MYKDEYPRLKWFANEYWKKYPNKNDFTAYINLISIYDFSIFEQIRQTLPARVNPILGLAIEPNVLERSKVVAIKGIRGENTDKFVKETNDISKLPTPTAQLPNKKTVILVGFDTEQINLDKLTVSDDIDLKFEIGGIASDDADGEFNVPINTSIINNNTKITKVETIKLKPRTSFIAQHYNSTIYETKQEISLLNDQYKTQMSFGLDKVSSVINPLYASSLYTDFDVSYNWENVYFDETLNEDIGYGYGWNYYSNSIGTKTAVISQIGNFRDEGFYKSYYFTYSSGDNLAEGIFDTYELTGSKYMNPHNNITSTRNRNFDGCKNSSPDVNVPDTSEPINTQPTVTVNLRCPLRPCPI